MKNLLRLALTYLFKFSYIIFITIILTNCKKEDNTTKPAINTKEVTEITSTSAISGGIIINDGGSKVTKKGICWSKTKNPTTEDHYINNTTKDDIFVSIITGLEENSSYYLRAYAGNTKGTSYGKQVEFTTFPSSELPSVQTYAVNNITSASAVVGGKVTSHGSTEVTERGIFWANNPNPEGNGNRLTIGKGWGEFHAALEGLEAETIYHVKAYAKNDSGISFGEQVEFETKSEDACTGINNPAGYGIVVYDGKCWLDRNLGASRVATATDDEKSLGHLFQWGRADDDHQYLTSPTTKTLAPQREQPNNNKFIVNDSNPFDWNSDKDWTTRWVTSNQNTTNADPCPEGWRVPTKSEWESAMEHENWSNEDDAFNSPLKLPSAGKRDDKGVVYDRGNRGYYWSSSHENIFGIALLFYDDGAFISNYYRVGGMSVRCVKDK